MTVISICLCVVICVCVISFKEYKKYELHVYDNYSNKEDTQTLINVINLIHSFYIKTVMNDDKERSWVDKELIEDFINNIDNVTDDSIKDYDKN